MLNMTKNMFGINECVFTNIVQLVIAPFQGFASTVHFFIGLCPMLMIVPLCGFKRNKTK